MSYMYRPMILSIPQACQPLSCCASRVYLTVKPTKSDILVKMDGTVQNNIAMYITVVCKINLFTYPFMDGECPVAINGWSHNCKMLPDGCMCYDDSVVSITD